MDLRLIEQMSRGSEAVVWLADDPLMSRRVVLRFLRGGSDDLRRQIASAHAQKLERMLHKNVVRVFGIESYPNPETNSLEPAIVMEHLEGPVLDDLAPTLDVATARSLILDITRGLAAIHEHGMVHGDLHGSNVIVTSTRAVIIDPFTASSQADCDAASAIANVARDNRELATLVLLILEKAPDLPPDERASIHALAVAAKSAQALSEALELRFSPPAPTARPPRAASAAQAAAADIGGILAWGATLPDRAHTWLERPELDGVLKRLAEPEGKSVMVLGGPGVGKSAFFARLGARLLDEGVDVVGLSLRALPTDCDEPEKIERWAGWTRAQIGERGRGGRTVVLIDQLDSLADLADIRSQRLAATLTLLVDLAALPGVRVACACREFESTHDLRLRQLDATRVSLSLPTWESVAPVLAAEGVLTEGVPDAMRELLRTPQFLTVFLQVRSLRGAAAATFTSYQEMLGALWSERVARDQGRVDLLREIANRMSEEEALTVPAALADGRRTVLDQLVAAGILREDGSNIAFAHQTLFDFERARMFAAGAQDLVGYVLARQEGLNVRPTMWSALNYLRETSAASYRRAFVALAFGDGVRAHIKALSADFLAQVALPDDAEVEWFVELLAVAGVRRRLLRGATANVAAWLPKLGNAVLLPEVAGPRGEDWAGFLIAAVALGPDVVTPLLMRAWPAKSPRACLSLMVMGYLQQWEPSTVQFATELVRERAGDSLGAERIIDALQERNPRDAVAVAAMLVASRLSALLRDTPEDQFARVSAIEKAFEDWLGVGRLERLAKSAPSTFLTEMTPQLLRALTLLRPPTDGDEWLPNDYLFDPHRQRGTSFLDALSRAVALVAPNDPDAIITWIAELVPSVWRLPHRLAGSGLALLPDKSRSEAVIGYVSADPRRLLIGRDKVLAPATVTMIASLRAIITAEEATLLEGLVGRIAAFADPTASPSSRRRRLARDRQLRGELLAHLPERFLSPAALIERGEAIAAKAAKDEAPDAQAGSGEMSEIVSTMSLAQMSSASDEQILRLFDGLPDTSGFHHPIRWFEGGSTQASRVLGELTARDPDRGARLLLRFQPLATESPVTHALRALADQHWRPETWQELVLDCDRRGFASREFRSGVSHAIAKHARDLQVSPAVVATLERWLLEPAHSRGAPPDDVAEGDDDDELTPVRVHAVPAAPEQGGRRRPIAGSRGSYELLPGHPFPTLNALFMVVVGTEPSDPDRFVRLARQVMTTEPDFDTWRVLARQFEYLNGAKDRSELDALLRDLFERWPDVLLCGSGVNLVEQTLRWSPVPEGVDRWIGTLLSQDSSFGQQAGGELLVLQSRFMRDRLPALLDRVGREDELDVRIGMGIAAAELWNLEGFRVEATQLILASLRSPDQIVRRSTLGALADLREWLPDEAGVSVFRRIADDPVLMRDAPGRLCSRLGVLFPVHAALAADFANAFLDSLAARDAPSESWTYSAGPELLNAALTLQRSQRHRVAGMNLFERLLEHDVYGIEAVLFDRDASPRLTAPPRRPTAD